MNISPTYPTSGMCQVFVGTFFLVKSAITIYSRKMFLILSFSRVVKPKIHSTFVTGLTTGASFGVMILYLWFFFLFHDIAKIKHTIPSEDNLHYLKTSSTRFSVKFLMALLPNVSA